MDFVTLGDLTFQKYLTAEVIDSRIDTIASELNTDYEDKNPIFLIILNGAFIVAADLLRKITIDHEIFFVEAKSYEGLRSTGHVSYDKDKLRMLTGRHVVIVEDIIDSGKTLNEFINYLNSRSLLSLEVMVLLSKPEARIFEVAVRYTCFEIPDLFVVGYGLDYNNKGRNLPHIYQLQNL